MTIDLSLNGPVAEILINRPEKLNAMTPRMAEQLAEACAEVNAAGGVRVVILRGNGDRAFCAGSDLKALDEYPDVWSFRNRLDYSTQIRALRKPCIAALQGWVLGGGLELALAADIRIAGDSAKFGAPEVTRGWVGAGGASQMLPRLVGYGRASYLLLRGSHIDANRALDWGIVEEVVPDEKLVDRVREMAGEMARNSTIALQTVKAAIRQSLSAPLAQGLEFENEVMALAFALGNDKQGRAAFIENKKNDDTAMNAGRKID